MPVGTGASAGTAKAEGERAERAKASASAFAKASGAAKAFGGNLAKIGAKSLSSSLAGLGGVMGALGGTALPTATEAMSAFGSAIGGGITSGAAKLSEALGALGPEGQAAGAALEVVAGAAAATIGNLSTLAGLAIDITQGFDLMRDRLTAFAGGAVAGAQVQAMVTKLGASLPFATAQVGSWAQSLLKAGVSASKLEDRLKAVAAAEALGEGGGAAATAFFQRLGEGGPAADKFMKDLAKGGRRSVNMLKEMGVRMKDLGGQAAVAKMSAKQLQDAVSKALQKKGAGPLADMAMTFPAILQKAREGFMSLFAKLGPAVKPFMTAVKALFANFNKGTPIMKSLQGVVTKVFSVLFGWATKAVGAISAMVKWFAKSGKAGGVFSGAIGVLKSAWGMLVSVFRTVAKALAPVFAHFRKLASSPAFLAGIKTAFKLIAVVIVVVIGVVAALVAMFVGFWVAVGAGVAYVVGELLSMLGAFSGVIDGIGSFVSGAISSLGGLASGAIAAAGNFISGLVSGIAGGASAVTSAVANLAKGALGAFTGLLGIHSDSAVMAKMGGHFAGGAETGIDKGTSGVAEKAADLGSAAAGAAGGAMAAGGKGAGGKGGVTINGGVHLTVPMGTASAWAEEAFAGFMDRLAASQGA